MATELQFLLDKIQTEGIEKANAEAARIIEDARQKAGAIVAEAESKAAESRRKGEADATLFQQRAEQSVRQAARDVVLDVKMNLDQTLQRVFLAKISETLTPDFLKTLLADLIKAYASSGDGKEGVEFKLSPEDMRTLAQSLVKEIQQRAAQGIRIAPDADVRAGFRVLLANGRMEHDFTAQTIQSALARLLRPALAGLVTRNEL